jgi:Icc-related predicted phosphoesterase
VEVQSEIDWLLKNKVGRADIIISHNSPAGTHDRPDGVHDGYEALTSHIFRERPAYLFHGHQHVNKTTRVGNTLVVGVYGAAVFDLYSGKVVWTADEH